MFGCSENFWLIALSFVIVLPLMPFMRRVATEENERARGAGASGLNARQLGA